MSKIKCVILDDELPGLTYLRMLCEQFDFVEIVKCFNSSQQFIEEVNTLDADIFLLDINMPGFTGLEVAQALKNKYVIFVSAHPEFAADAYDLEAIDFIKKPVIKDRLEKALIKARKLILEKEDTAKHFSWNTNLGKTIIFFDEILYIRTSEVDKRDKVIVTDERTLLLKNITIEKLLSFLPARQFMQVNKAEIISRKAVQAHSANEVILKLKSGSQKQLSVTLGESFRKFFADWIE